MADITVTATSVVPGAGATINKDYYFGETVTAGMSVYLKSSDTKIYKAQCDGTPAEAAIFGVALNGGAVNQPAFVQTSGLITIGATVVATGVYVVSSTYGGIAPHADLASTNYLSIVGYATTTGILYLTPNATGVQK